MQEHETTLPVLDHGEVHLWYGHMPQVPTPEWLARMGSVLSPAEQARAGRMKAPNSRCEAVALEGLLRRLLGASLGVAPESLRFLRGPYGKPYLPPPHEGLCFNATHTDGMAVLAVGRDRALGVDVEAADRRVSETLLRKALADDERAGLAGLAPSAQAHRFLRHWTLKEAYLKCLGLGLRVRPQRVAFALTPPRLTVPAPGHEGPVSCWQETVDGYVVALVAEGSAAPAVTVRPLPEAWIA